MSILWWMSQPWFSIVPIIIYSFQRHCESLILCFNSFTLTLCWCKWVLELQGRRDERFSSQNYFKIHGHEKSHLPLSTECEKWRSNDTSLSFSQVDIKHVTKLSTILRNLRQNHSSRDTHEAPADLKTKHLPKAFAIAWHCITVPLRWDRAADWRRDFM